MKCPDDIAEVLLRILGYSLLRIRQFGDDGLSEECASEADHVHNIPALLENYSPALLEYYWKVERVSFLKKTECETSLVRFEDEWENLHHLMEAHGVATAEAT